MRIALTSHPRCLRHSSRRGCSWRSLAATDALAASSDQPSSSTWPGVSQLVKLIVRDEFAQRDRFMRENLDAMAQKVGEMQAKLVKLEAMGERVSGMAGVKSEEWLQIAKPPEAPGGKGGPFVPAQSPSLEQLNGWVGALDEQTDQNTDLFT